MEMKKVTVSTVSTRKFVENLVYLGSLGGVIDDNCVTVKGPMFLRADVMLPVDVPVNETQEMKVAPGLPITVDAKQEEQKKEQPKAKKTTRKSNNKKAEDKPSDEDSEESTEEV